MDFVFYRDATETALNYFKIQDYHKNGDTVLKMFVSIGDLIYDCLDTKGFIQTNNFLVDGSDAVYRRLNVIAQFLSDVKPLHLLAFRKFDRVKINEIKWTIKDILKAISQHMYNYQGLEKGFQQAYDVYLFSHNVPYSSIGKRLYIVLDFVKDLSDLTEWSPPKMFLYYKYLNVEVNIKSDRKCITLCDKYIETIEYDVHEEAAVELALFCLRGVEIPSMESFDWTFELFQSFQGTPLVYVYSACNTVGKLLAVSRHFQQNVAIKRSYSHLSILLIFKMCNALLLRGYFCRKKLTLQNITDILNVVFSVVDRLIPETITTNSNNHTFIESIFEELTLLISLCPKYDKLLIGYNTTDYLNYYDVIYKFIFMYFYQHHEIPAGLMLCQYKTIIHRPFQPNEIGTKMEDWNLKFERYSNVSQLFLLAEEDLRCTICQKDLVLDQTEIAIPERCNHLSCSSCLMEKLNVITKDSKLETLPKSFSCPNSSCEMKHTGFITDGHYNRLRSEAMKAMFDLD